MTFHEPSSLRRRRALRPVDPDAARATSSSTATRRPLTRRLVHTGAVALLASMLSASVAACFSVSLSTLPAMSAEEAGPARDADAPVSDADASAAASDADASSSPAYGPLVVLAPAQPDVRSIVLDDSFAYWIHASGPSRVSRATRRPQGDGGAALVVVTATAAGFNGAGMALASTTLFGAGRDPSGNVGAIFACDKLGGNLKFYWSNDVNGASSVAASGTALFIAGTGGSDPVKLGNQDGTGALTSLGGVGASVLRADASNLYFVRGSQILRMSKGGEAAGLSVVADVGSPG